MRYVTTTVVLGNVTLIIISLQPPPGRSDNITIILAISKWDINVTLETSKKVHLIKRYATIW